MREERVDVSLVEVTADFIDALVKPVLFRTAKQFVCALKEADEYDTFVVKEIRKVDLAAQQAQASWIGWMQDSAVNNALLWFLKPDSVIYFLEQAEELITSEKLQEVVACLFDDPESKKIVEQIFYRVSEIALDEFKRNRKIDPDALILRVGYDGTFRHLSRSLLQNVQKNPLFLKIINDTAEKIILKTLSNYSWINFGLVQVLAVRVFRIFQFLLNKFSNNDQLAREADKKIDKALSKIHQKVKQREQLSELGLPPQTAEQTFSDGQVRELYKTTNLLQGKSSDNYVLSSEKKSAMNNFIKSILEKFLDKDRVTATLSYYLENFREGNYDNKIIELLSMADQEIGFPANKQLALIKQILSDNTIRAILLNNIGELVENIHENINNYSINPKEILQVLSFAEVSLGKIFAKEKSVNYGTDAITIANAATLKRKLTAIIDTKDKRDLALEFVFSQVISLIASKREDSKLFINGFVDIIVGAIKSGAFDDELKPFVGSGKLKVVKKLLSPRLIKSISDDIFDALTEELASANHQGVEKNSKYLFRKIIKLVNPLKILGQIKEEAIEKVEATVRKLPENPAERFSQLMQEFSDQFNEAMFSQKSLEQSSEALYALFLLVEEAARDCQAYTINQIISLQKTRNELGDLPTSAQQLCQYLDKINGNTALTDDEFNCVARVLNLEEKWRPILKNVASEEMSTSAYLFSLFSYQKSSSTFNKEVLKPQLERKIIEFEQQESDREQLDRDINNFQKINQESCYIINHKAKIESVLQKDDREELKELQKLLEKSQKRLQKYIEKQSRLLQYSQAFERPLYHFSPFEKLIFSVLLKFYNVQKKQDNFHVAGLLLLNFGNLHAATILLQNRSLSHEQRAAHLSLAIDSANKIQQVADSQRGVVSLFSSEPKSLAFEVSQKLKRTHSFSPNNAAPAA